jgi:HEPN domain-containing protein
MRIIDSPIFLRFGVPAILLLAIFWGYFFGKPDKPKVKPFALLERIQYVQELYLVSYRYEEMILLGVPPKFDRKQDELNDLKKLRLQLQDSIAADSGRVRTFREKEYAFVNRYHFWTQREDSLRNAVKKIKRKRRKSEAFALWKAAQDSLKTILKNTKSYKKERDNLYKLITNTHKSIVKLDDQIERMEKNWNANERLNQAEALVVTPVEVSAFVDLRQARFIFFDGGKAARIDSLRDSLTTEDYILSDQYLAAIAGVDSTDSVDTEFKKSMNYRIDSISLLPDRRLEVFLPYPQISEPVVDLDTTRTVNLANSLTPSIYRNYFEVFQALAEEVREIKKDVSTKAIDTGILAEAEAVAETYVRSFVASLPQYDAYQVNITFTNPATINRVATAARIEN